MPATIDPLHYRRVVGRYATGVTVVTTVADGVHHAMTCNSFTSVSLDPVLALFCADKSARLHDAVLRSGVAGVSVLAAHQEDLSRWFATSGRSVQGQFDRVPHSTGPATGTVLLDEALATFELRTTSTVDAGDHTVVVAEVLGVATPHPEVDPLLYVAGAYRTLG